MAQTTALWLGILTGFLLTLVCGAAWKIEAGRHIAATKRELSTLDWARALAEDEGARLRAEQLAEQLDRTVYIVTGHTQWGEATWLDGVFSDKQDAVRSANMICQSKWHEQNATIEKWTINGDRDTPRTIQVEPNPLPPPSSYKAQ